MTHLIYFGALVLLSCNSQQFDKSFSDKEQQNFVTHQSKNNQTDTMKRPFQIIFNDVGEIRMGSPYNSCSIEIVGNDKIQLPKASWQDKLAWTDDSKTLVLVRWDLVDNNPVFKLVKIDTETGTIKESIRMLGAINDLTVTGNTVSYNKFYYDKVKSKEKLCCDIEEDYTFK